MYENSYTLKTLPGLINNTYILAIVFALIFIGISFLISSIIAYEGGTHPKDAFKRRIWFFVLGANAAIIFFLFNYFYVISLIKGAPAKSDFMLHNGIATALVFIVYLVVGILLSKTFKKGKYGTIFPSK